MTNVNAAATQLSPNGGITNAKHKIGLLVAVAKAAQNDTITITNASEVISVHLYDTTTGVIDAPTVVANVITLTTAATGTVTGQIVYK